MQVRQQGADLMPAVVGEGLPFAPAIFPVGLNEYAQFRQRRRVGCHVRANRVYGAGCRRMDRKRTPGAVRQRLPAQNAVADLDAQFALRPQVLLQRDNQLFRQTHPAQRHAARLDLHLRWMNPALKIPNSVFPEDVKQLKHGVLLG